jgi:hypothetical protein
VPDPPSIPQITEDCSSRGAARIGTRSPLVSRPFSLRSASAVALACSALSSAAAVSFNDVQFWAGTGANRAALVIDFNDAKAPESLVWGYRWNGAATGEDMFVAVVAADPRLYAKRKAFSFGTANLGIGYDTNGNGFAISDGTAFDPVTGIAAGNENQADGATPTDPVDHYREGWNTGFFDYFTADANPYGGTGTWAESQVGAGSRNLVDGSWDGLSFAPDFAGVAPGEPTAAVPEPTAGLLALGGGLMLTASRTRRA